MELAWKGSKGSSLERVYASSEENAIIKEQKFGLRLKVMHLKYTKWAQKSYTLTAQWGAQQPEGTLWNPGIKNFWHPESPGTHVWIYQWFDQLLGFSCFRSKNSKSFGLGAYWNSKLTHISWFWTHIGTFFDMWQPKSNWKRGVWNYQWIRRFGQKFLFWDFLYTIRHTKWKDLANKNPWAYKMICQNSYKCKHGKFL